MVAVFLLAQATVDFYLANSTVSGNFAGNYGGGVSLAPGNTGIITNCTIYGNTSNGYGGGIYSAADEITITSSTIANNHSDNNNNTGTEYGGGIYFDSGTLTVQNTIFANNYIGSADTTGDDYYYNSGTLVDNGYNVVKYQAGSTETGKAFDDITDILYNTPITEKDLSDPLTVRFLVFSNAPFTVISSVAVLLALPDNVKL
jgi:predicted outer membrane repeat protein